MEESFCKSGTFLISLSFLTKHKIHTLVDSPFLSILRHFFTMFLKSRFCSKKIFFKICNCCHFSLNIEFFIDSPLLSILPFLFPTFLMKIQLLTVLKIPDLINSISHVGPKIFSRFCLSTFWLSSILVWIIMSLSHYELVK